MLIAQITDIHIGFDRDNPDELNLQRLRAVVDRLTTGPNRPDLLLMSGDLTESGDAESYARLADALRPCTFPIWAMAGNHDERAPLLAAFAQTPSHDGFVQYVLPLGGMRLVVLDTLEPGRHGGAFCAARADWLRARLAEDPTTPTYIAMHHPPFESGLAWLDSGAGEPWIARLAAALADFPQVRGIVSGHLHRAIQSSWNGLAVTVCPSAAPAVALDLRPVDPDAPDQRALITDEPPGYALHHWDGTRLVTHLESAAPHNTLARFDASLQPMIRGMLAERDEA